MSSSSSDEGKSGVDTKTGVNTGLKPKVREVVIEGMTCQLPSS